MGKKRGKELRIELKDSFIDDSKMLSEEYWGIDVEIITPPLSSMSVPSSPYLREIKMSNAQQPIALDEDYKIRDNQFWYNKCSFRHLIENKKSIVVNIEGLGTRTFIHSEQGRDGRPTYSYRIPSSAQKWWYAHLHKIITVELLRVEE